MRRLAFDKATSRRVDVDGRLHISVNNISKADVNPYYGREIPGYEELRLDPDKVYNLLRDPTELEKAAGTFNNIPVLSEHVPVSAEEPMQEIVIGSTGTDAAFTYPFLRNSAVIWVQDEIDLVNSEEKRNWSCAYRYTADMTPGVFKGLRYDGVMRDIVGNHLALVEQGRAGPEVVVGDSQPKGEIMLKSRRALMLQGALIAQISPMLAAGAKVNFVGALDSVTAKNLKSKTPALAKTIVALVGPSLAADEGLEVSDVVAIIDAVQGVDPVGTTEDDDLNPIDDPDATPAVDADGDAMAQVLAFLEGKLSPEDLAEVATIANGPAAAEDEDPEEEDMKKKDPPAMDAAAIRAATIAEVNAIRDAEAAVFPHIGKLAVAMDSAAKVYRLALENAGVDLKGVSPSAFRSMVAMLPNPALAPVSTVAMDAAGISDFKARNPLAATLIRS